MHSFISKTIIQIIIGSEKLELKIETAERDEIINAYFVYKENTHFLNIRKANGLKWWWKWNKQLNNKKKYSP